MQPKINLFVICLYDIGQNNGSASVFSFDQANNQWSSVQVLGFNSTDSFFGTAIALGPEVAAISANGFGKLSSSNHAKCSK